MSRQAAPLATRKKADEMGKLIELFEQHCGASAEKQFALSDFLGDHEWRLDFDQGVIIFNNRHRLPMQVLGTESQLTDTWLWSWANDHIEEALTQESRRLRDLGEDQDIEEFTNPHFATGRISGHYLAMIAAGVCNAAAYYRCPYENGAYFILFSTDLLQKFLPRNALSVAKLFEMLVQQFDFNHRRGLLYYLKYKNFQPVSTSSEIKTVLPTGQTLKAAFDAQNRLRRIRIQ